MASLMILRDVRIHLRLFSCLADDQTKHERGKCKMETAGYEISLGFEDISDVLIQKLPHSNRLVVTYKLMCKILLCPSLLL